MKDILSVYWKRPETLPPDGDIVLSFLSPAAEEELKKEFKGRVISAAEIAPKIKAKALKSYISLVAKIGATPLKNNKTLRQALKLKEGFSLWWFHKVSNKDCEKDPTFQLILEARIILFAAGLCNKSKVLLLGGQKELGEALRSALEVKIISSRKSQLSFLLARSLASRIKYSFLFFGDSIFIRLKGKAPQLLFDVVLGGFWNWSVSEDEATHELRDKYFKSLPDKLASKNLRIGWFLWFDSKASSGASGLKDRLKSLKNHDNLVVLQYFLKIKDLLKAIFDFRPYLIFSKLSGSKEFRRVFSEEEIDFYPIFKKPLIYGFLNCVIPHFQLVYTAALRAFKKYRPSASVSFLELFLHSRAFYAAAKAARPDIINYAVQHASYSREKTFLRLDPEKEYRGCPDNLSIPKPDYLFAMGQLGEEIFVENGFPKERIFATGSSRYEHVRVDRILKSETIDKFKNLLLITSLDRRLEMKMVEAVYSAAKDLPGIRLFLRSHPFAKMKDYPDFRAYKNRVQLIEGSLEDNLKKADLILFSYSTVAEEAFIRGIPVWQWLPLSYNGSVFRDLEIIPSFNSVGNLREALKRFIIDPNLFMPNEEDRKFIVRQCFYAADGKASERIAAHIQGDFSKKEPEYIGLGNHTNI